jgi:hypothetical protein
MLISGSHSQILMPQQLGNRVNVRALHSHPACRCMPKIVKSEVLDADLSASTGKRNTDPFRADATKQQVRGIALRHNDALQGSHGQIVQIHDSAFAVLRLRQQQTAICAVDIEFPKPQDL